MAKKDMSRHINQTPEFFDKLLEGRSVPIDFSISIEDKPPWLDEKKFKKGQKFVRRQLTGIMFPQMLTMMMSFQMDSFIAPLLYAGKADKPFTALIQYMSNVKKIMTFFDGNLWDKNNKGRKNLTIIRSKHKQVFSKMTRCSSEELRKKTQIGEIWCPLTNVLVKDFATSCPFSPKISKSVNHVWLSQFDMSFQQFTAVAMAICYPKKFGLHGVSDYDLEAFLHVWRVIGFLLGIKDKYNFCDGNLETVRLKSRNLLDFLVKPSFRNINEKWEHVSRCAIDGFAYLIPFGGFDVALSYLCYVLQINAPNLNRSLGVRKKLSYNFMKILFPYFFRVPGVMPVSNVVFKIVIDRGSKLTPDDLRNGKISGYPSNSYF